MYESYNAALILWPARSLPASVAAALGEAGVDLTTKQLNGRALSAKETADGTVVLDLTFEGCEYGLTGLEPVLATLRLARISYVAWGAFEGQIAGTGRSFDPEQGVEYSFTVMSDGEPVLTASDLEELEGRFGTAEALSESIRRWLRLPTPEDLSDLDRDDLSISIEPDDDDDDDDDLLSCVRAAGARPRSVRREGR